jgi:eukaryotic-like serine/threonine-protein kinase
MVMDAERWKRVDDLLQSVLEVPDDQRKEFLRQACAGDAALEQEVESLLSSHRKLGDFLQSPALPVLPSQLISTVSHTARPEVNDDQWLGQTMSHYRVLRRLGRGGMGMVYEAEDLRLGRHVALKLLLDSEADSAKALLRFQHEARAISTLNHPHICTLYEVEEHEGKPVIVMELLQGETLKQRLEAGRVPLRQLLQWGTEVADALEAAHTAGLLHRDIKPANIFISQRGSAKVLDFGLAKQSPGMGGGPSTVEEESLTSMGMIPGTTAYMSPEQVRGENLDGRTDLFSFGLVLYEMASGNQPFAEKNIALTLDAVLHRQPPSPREINAELPLELERIIQKALEKDREQRYPSADALRADLQQLWHDTDSGAVRAYHVPAVGLNPDVPADFERPIAKSLDRDSNLRDQHASEIKTDLQRLKWDTERGRIAAPTAQKGKFWKIFVYAAVVVAALIGGGIYYRWHRTKPLTEKDTVVLADFDNKTGDTVFDDALKQALAVELGQSPFLNVLPDRKVSETLQMMGRPANQRITPDVSRELCLRTGSKAVLSGTISSLGTHYLIGLNAVACDTGDTLAKEQVDAASKEDVLRALSRASSSLRSKLGESLPSVQKFDVPIEATTSSLEALKNYSMGLTVLHQKGDAPSVPFLKRAIELDPNFPMAYAALANSYGNLQQPSLALEYATKAYNLRDRASERERMRISATYFRSTGEVEKETQIYELWTANYPRDFVPRTNLGTNYSYLGQYEKALQEYQEALRLLPNTVGYEDLGITYLNLNRLDDAQTSFDQALAHKLDSGTLRQIMYVHAFLQGDVAQMAQLMSWAAGRPGDEDPLLSLQSDTEACYGRMAKARDFSRRAADSAVRAGSNEAAAFWEVNAALREAELGNAISSKQEASKALLLSPGRDVKIVAALALARIGDSSRAKALARELETLYPTNTLLKVYWLPTIDASVELNKGNSVQALQDLELAAPYEQGLANLFINYLYPAYVRGQAYLLAHNGTAAVTEFQKLLDHRGTVANFVTGSLAHLQLGRAYAMAGDTVKAKAAYEDFLTLWKDADPDIPILKQAKAEYEKLGMHLH